MMKGHSSTKLAVLALVVLMATDVVPDLFSPIRLLGVAEAFMTPYRPGSASLSPLFRKTKSMSPSIIASTTAPVDNDATKSSLEPKTDDQEDEGDKFDWMKAWYPLVPIEMLDPEIPHHFTLLGMDLVVWNDGKVPGATLLSSKKDRSKKTTREMGEWRVFADECPHRKVPLSEGRVEEDGSLLCSYHGWRFDGQHGCLVDAPQLEPNSAQLQAIQQNPKTQCNSFPAQIINGVLWVWPQTGEDARLESLLTPAQSYQEIDDIQTKDPERVWIGPWNYRQLPYGADFFLENVVDPAHVPVSHHNIVGSRYGDQRLTMKQKTKLTKDGFSVSVVRPTNISDSTITFRAPAHVALKSPFGQEGAFQTLELYASPSLPGFCNHVGRMVIVKDKTGTMPKMLKRFTAPLPKWVNHVLAASFLNQDAVFLHQQERLMAKKGDYTTLNPPGVDGGMDYNQAIFPIDADKGVIYLRRWLSKFAGGQIPYANNLTMPPIDPNVCFDQYNSHTATCQICQKALSRLKKIRFATFVLATCVGVLRPLAKPVLNLIAVFSTAGFGLLLNKLIGMFYKNEFSHSHND